MSYKILEYHDIPNAIARKLLKRYLASKPSEVPEIVNVVVEYLEATVKCDEAVVEALYEELKSQNLKEATISMILNVLPATVDELRILLNFEDKAPDESALKNIVETISARCKRT